MLIVDNIERHVCEGGSGVGTMRCGVIDTLILDGRWPDLDVILGVIRPLSMKRKRLVLRHWDARANRDVLFFGFKEIVVDEFTHRTFWFNEKSTKDLYKSVKYSVIDLTGQEVVVKNPSTWSATDDSHTLPSNTEVIRIQSPLQSIPDDASPRVFEIELDPEEGYQHVDGMSVNPGRIYLVVCY